MSKLSQKHTNEIIQKVQSLLNYSEFKVFTQWIRDDDSFSACHQVLSERTNISKTNISRAIKGLMKKNCLIETGYKFNKTTHTRYKTYDLHPALIASSPIPTPGPTKENTLELILASEQTKETAMTNDDKIYKQIISEHKYNKTFLKGVCANDIVSHLKGAGLIEEEVEYYLKKYVKAAQSEILSIKCSPTFGQAQKAKWSESIQDFSDAALLEYFPAPVLVKAESIASNIEISSDKPMRSLNNPYGLSEQILNSLQNPDSHFHSTKRVESQQNAAFDVDDELTQLDFELTYKNPTKERKLEIVKRLKELSKPVLVQVKFPIHENIDNEEKLLLKKEQMSKLKEVVRDTTTTMEVKELLNEQVDALQIEIDDLVQKQPITFYDVDVDNL